MNMVFIFIFLHSCIYRLKSKKSNCAKTGVSKEGYPLLVRGNPIGAKAALLVRFSKRTDSSLGRVIQ